MFEAMYDIQYYYKNGYGVEANVEMGNAIVNDLAEFLT